MSTDTTFAQLLYPLGHGCALFDPDPCGQYDRVRPGDVGYIRSGKFHRAFNVFFTETDLVNKRGVPEGFKHLNIEEEHIDKSAPLPPGVLHSKSVKVHGLSLDASVNAIKDGISVDLSCSKQRGAALLTKFPAYREDTLRLLDMKECFITHYNEWLEFLNGKLRRDITLSEMILVTGCTMTADWATTVFSESTRKATVSFQVGYAPIGSVQFSLRAQNENHLSSSHLIGPTSRYGNKELVSFDSRSDDIVVDGRKFDQCIFLRGYRLKERNIFGKPKVKLEELKLKAAAGPHNLPYRNDDDDSCQAAGIVLTTDLVSLSDGSSDESDLSKEKVISHNSIYDVMLDYILENSNVDIAVVHDNDIPLLFSAKEDFQDFHIEKGDLMITNDDNIGIDIGSIGAKAQSRPIENAKTSEHKSCRRSKRDRDDSSADEVQMEFKRGSTNDGGVDYSRLVDSGSIGAKAQSRPVENAKSSKHKSRRRSKPHSKRYKNNSSVDEVQMESQRGSTNNGRVSNGLVDAPVVDFRQESSTFTSLSLDDFLAPEISMPTLSNEYSSHSDYSDSLSLPSAVVRRLIPLPLLMWVSADSALGRMHKDADSPLGTEGEDIQEDT